MTVKRSDVEIMAPVGCYESLAAAVQAAAHAAHAVGLPRAASAARDQQHRRLVAG